MQFPFRLRSTTRSRTGNFAPTAVGLGVINFDRWLDFCPEGFHIKIAISYRSDIAIPTALLEFVNPTPLPESVDATTGQNTDRRVILRDTTGTLTDFIEDNLGTWWTVPMRIRPDLPYELHFTTTGAVANRTQTLMVDIAYFPNWPSQQLHGMLRRLAECGPAVEPRAYYDDLDPPDRPIDPTTGQ